MQKGVKYIYCIAKTALERNFGPIGIGGRGDEVSTVGCGDLSMVVSDTAETRYAVSRDNVLAHERVVEEAMKEFTVLPVRFCTIAPSAGKIQNLLDTRQREFNGLLKDMDYKVELSVKAVWKNTDAVFEEILKESGEIRGLKEKLQNDSGRKNTEARIALGRMVEQELESKKDREAEAVLAVLKKAAVDYRVNRPYGDRMFLSAAFLVNRGREKEFDNLMEDLGKMHEDRVKFLYVGNIPPYNFSSITIHPEEWEV
ncbi:MAG: GvpL/GvpF family gas vesicle protein [Thermodesulfovibrionales bacterium]|nr:GvpL/GvpF family gas vesicle protein [Thermodesulfovibrionales bacterium]